MKTDWNFFAAALNAHQAFDAIEAVHIAKTLTFLAETKSRFWQRATLQGHVTGSAFVVDQHHSHALLLHHAKLNRWVQPGGHLDETDDSPAAGALREAIEETGIATLTLASEALFDVDVHAIPARNKDGMNPNANEPAHFHYDARYLVISPQSAVAISEESLGFRWVALRELAEGNHESGMVRMAKKVLQRHHS
jgi:8-oxo-dGTP pyrophosphatase MutT (NUDIX family)